MGKIINLLNRKFGRLLVIKFSHKDKFHKAHWICKCDCGFVKSICGRSLLSGDTKSCGCYRIDELKSESVRNRVSAYNKKVGRWAGKNNPGYGKKGAKNVSYRKEVRDKIRLSKIGDKNPAWKDGASCYKYSLIFHRNKFKNIILCRDHYTCQNCGITKMLSFKVFGRNLSVHHINYNKKDCTPNNLISLCHGCNARANQKRSFWKSFYQNKIQNV